MKKQLSAKKIMRNAKSLEKVYYYDTIDSTNDEAKRLVNTFSGNFLVIASHQTKGRGRWNRSFFSPSGSGLYFSLVLRPSIPTEKCALVTVATAVAVAEEVEKFSGKKADIKWVNDIFIDGKKCVGILTESIFENGKPLSVIIGVGINLTTADFPDEIKEKAGNIGEVDRNALVSAICDKIACFVENLEEKKFMSGYASRCFLLEKEVSVYDKITDETFTARAEEIDEEGRLIVVRNGERLVLSSEEVSLKVSNEQ